MATALTFSRASRAKSSCSTTGSGVVSDGPGGRPSAINPSVPSDAALRPAAPQIWRRKSTLLVLPFVPVIATTHSGWTR